MFDHVGDDILVLDITGLVVHSLTSEVARCFELVSSGATEMENSDALDALLAAGLVEMVGDGPREEYSGITRRKALAFGMVGAGVIAIGISSMALPAAASASSGVTIPTVNLGSSAAFAVLGGSTVTNTGPSVVDGNLGVSPGSAVTGFPPAIVVPPGTIHAADEVAAQAQTDLTAAYVDAAGRSVDGVTTTDLAGLTLQGGVYSGPGKAPLTLSGALVLDGADDPNAVFIFQTDTTLITSSASSISLINEAKEGNVFWQVGSSATLGTGSTFAGNILAMTSITVTTGVTVYGRVLAHDGAVTLDTDTFIRTP